MKIWLTVFFTVWVVTLSNYGVDISDYFIRESYLYAYALVLGGANNGIATNPSLTLVILTTLSAASISAFISTLISLISELIFYKFRIQLFGKGSKKP